MVTWNDLDFHIDFVESDMHDYFTFNNILLGRKTNWGREFIRKDWSDGINNDLSTASEFVYVEQEQVVAV